MAVRHSPPTNSNAFTARRASAAGPSPLAVHVRVYCRGGSLHGQFRAFDGFWIFVAAPGETYILMHCTSGRGSDGGAVFLEYRPLPTEP